MCRRYKPNTVYVLKIDGSNYYVGCHCNSKEIYESGILFNSGNPLNAARQKNELTLEEYKNRVQLVHTEEFDSKQDALNKEVELIEIFKDFYGDRCLNKSLGNKLGQTGLSRSEDVRKKISRSQGVLGVLQYTKAGKFLREYPSIMEASRQTGISYKNICPCCKGKLKSAGGYIWCYKQG